MLNPELIKALLEAKEEQLEKVCYNIPKTKPTWKDTILAIHGLEVCSKCGKISKLGSVHCRIPTWSWGKIITKKDKPIADKARAAWNRAARKNLIAEGTDPQDINDFYRQCPQGCKVVHRKNTNYALENLMYVPK